VIRRWLRCVNPVAGLGALAFCGVVGYLAVMALGSTTSTTTESYVRLATTGTRTVRVVEHGRVVVKRIPVVRHIYAKPVTVQETRTISTPSGTKTVTRDVVAYKPVYRRKVIRVGGKQVTVKQVVTDTRMLTDTQLLTVTNGVTNEHTVVNEHTVNSTVTNQQTQTQTHTQTQTQTVTVTVVSTNNETTTLTVTDTATVTVTTPGDTVTVTGTT
jgi:hypothetical protein